MIQQVPNIRLEPENFCYWLQGFFAYDCNGISFF